MSRLILRRLAIAGSALIITAVVAASGAPANGKAAPTVRPTVAQAPGVGVSSRLAEPCRPISPWITRRGRTFRFLFCVTPEGPALVLLGLGPVGCVLTPGRSGSCEPGQAAAILGY